MIQKLLSRLGYEKRGFVYDPVPVRDPALAVLFGAQPGTAGVTVTEANLKTVCAFYSGMRLLCDVVALMPLTVMARDEKKGDYELVASKWYKKVMRQPNPNMTAYQWKWLVVSDIIIYGNSYNLLKDGCVWPLPAAQVTVKYTAAGDKVYKFTARNQGEKDETYSAEQILHVPGPGYDGTVAPRLIQYCRDSLALSLATEQFGAAFFGNNAVPGAIVEHPGDLDIVNKRRLEDEIEVRLKTPSRARRVLLLDEGMKMSTVAVNPNDGQFLETRELQVREVCRWLRVPPHMIYDMAGQATWGMEQLSLDFLTYSIKPWIETILGPLNTQLLSEAEQDRMYFWFQSDAITPQDKASRFQNYATGRNNSIYTLNDILRRERMPLLDPKVGDVLIAPSTMKAIGASDPTTPIPPEEIKSVIDLIAAQRGINYKDAETLIRAALPAAEDAVVAAILKCANVQKVAAPNQNRDQ